MPHHTSERGISGVETAIVFVAFVMVSAVFAFTAMHTSIFTSERGATAIADGFGATRGGVQLTNGLLATSDGTRLTALKLDLTLGAGADSIVLDPAADGRTRFSYSDGSTHASALAYTAIPFFGDDDLLLEGGELFEITIDLTQDPSIDIGANDRFVLEVHPSSGSSTVIQRTAPSSISSTTIELH